MSTSQTGVGVAAVGLLAANLFAPAPGSAYAGDRNRIAGTLTGRSIPPSEAHAAFIRVGLGLIGIVVLVVMAGMGGSWTIGAASLVAALWVLWAINRYNPGGVSGGGAAS